MTPEQVHAVGVAALNNALALMDDARLLYEAGRVPRAFALGVIAVEEVAKVYVCRRLLQGWTGTLTVVQLNRELRPGGSEAHVRRYADTLERLATMAGGTPLPPGFDNIEALAKSDMRTRELALYVEVAPSGDPIAPATDEEGARLWFAGMVKLFAMLRSAWRSALNDELENARRSVAARR